MRYCGMVDGCSMAVGSFVAAERAALAVGSAVAVNASDCAVVAAAFDDDADERVARVAAAVASIEAPNRVLY